MFPHLVDAFLSLTRFRSLDSKLPDRGGALSIGGLPGGSAAVLVAALVRKHPQRTFLVVSTTPSDAERWLADLTVLLGDQVRLYPQREALGEEEPHLEIAGERVETIQALLYGEAQVVVTTTRATAELTAMAGAVEATRLTVAVGDRVRPGEVRTQLERVGYERRPSVSDVAQFAVRGGIMDVYGFGMAAPTRIEWWDDEVVSIRAFDLDSQRSERSTESVTMLPVGAVGGQSAESPHPEQDAAGVRLEGPAHPPAGGGPEGRKSLLDLIPPDTMLLVESGATQSEVDRMWSEAEHHLEVARRRGEDVPGRDALFLNPVVWSEGFERFARLLLDGQACDFDMQLSVPGKVERNMKSLAAIIQAGPTLVLCDNEGQLERLEELVSHERPDGTTRLPQNLTLAIGALHAGFVMQGLAVLTDHEIFRRARRIRRRRRYRQAMTAAPAGALTPGEYVVHLDHGIGMYRGVETISTGDGSIEVAVLTYEGGDRLNVPLYRIDQLERYRAVGAGEEESPPRLDRLGGSRWKRRRTRTQAAIRKLATELLELYARRSVAEGFAFPLDNRWQAELESAFLYEDTPDQRTATDEIKENMGRPLPMDRLVVGDVGYGKTEIAVRAAFKAAVAGKQVAVLVPTTILAEQHGRTFDDRMADFPVNTEILSRFRTPAEQRTVLRRLAEGKVDVVIGTHRLLSKDVVFQDLGLLIVDEEHRFGVRHKERLKQLRLEVDVLTLTATPIPRTLHLALAGLRDLSLIQTPPRDRSPVLTFVEPWDDELLMEVIARELDRGGQVFFVHNRIETIDTIVERVRRLAPRARVAVGHGKMPERDLDSVMRRFGQGEVDILVSTMIVESGLDVPNANTMIVHRAENFGLAQLYQLRGRVGRGYRRAYCYLIVPDHIDPGAENRLKLLEHHTELGSGYRLALRDLELRGAGNFFGAEQSGHAHAVGFDLYMRWLADTVRALKGEGVARDAPPPEVTLDGPAHLPDAFVCDEDAKLDFYRRLARAQELGEIADIREELRDRFGPLPEEADRLLTVFELRVLGAGVGLQTVMIHGDEARLKFRRDAVIRLAGLTAALDEVQFAADVRQTMPLSLRLTRLGGLAIGSGLVRALTAALEEPGSSVSQRPMGVKE
jgi:transcription-repair coupling factor (superfamily II helicase)